MPPKFCAGFKPPSKTKQLDAIGLTPRLKPSCEALCRCLDPSPGHWEAIEPPEEGEWLEAMLENTPDQSFERFLDSHPNVPDRVRNKIYLQPLCDPSELEAAPFPQGPWPAWTLLEQAVREFYQPLQVVTLPATPMKQLRPKPQSRDNDYGRQYNARQVLEALKGTSVPKDAFCTLAVTMHDLYPRDSWNFVYGLASLSERVGVFSFVRHTPDSSMPPEQQEGSMLHDSMKTMLHEIGHMFGLKHCTYFNCLMRGNNGAGVEHQKNYLHLCPVCLRKLHSSLGFDVPRQYEGLLRIFERFESVSDGFQRDCEFLRARLTALQDLPPNATVDRKRTMAMGARLPTREGAPATQAVPSRTSSKSTPTAPAAASGGVARERRAPMGSGAKNGQGVARTRPGPVLPGALMAKSPSLPRAAEQVGEAAAALRALEAFGGGARSSWKARASSSPCSSVQ